DRDASRREIAIEQHLVAEWMAPQRRTQRLIAALDWREREGRRSRAEDERRHHHVQAVQTTRGLKTRDGLRPALHPDAAISTRRPRGGGGGRRELWGVCRRRAPRLRPRGAVVGASLPVPPQAAPRRPGGGGRGRAGARGDRCPRARGAPRSPAAPSTADRPPAP